MIIAWISPLPWRLVTPLFQPILTYDFRFFYTRSSGSWAIIPRGQRYVANIMRTRDAVSRISLDMDSSDGHFSIYSEGTPSIRWAYPLQQRVRAY